MAEAENTKISAASRQVQNRPIHVPAAQQRTVSSSLKTDASPTPRRMSSDLDLGKSSSLPESPAASKPTSVRTPRRPAPLPPSGTLRPQLNTPRLGPVFSPVRQVPQASGSPTPRRVSYVCTVFSVPVCLILFIRNPSAAWTLPPVQPVVQPSAAPSSLSFAEIQQSQILQGKPAPRDKRSLIEIQEEEQAIRLEEDFMKWWTAEEARTQEEARLAAEALDASSRSRKQGGKKPRPSARSTPAGGSSRKGRRGERPSQSMTTAAGESSNVMNPNIVPSGDGQKSRSKPSANS